MPVFVSKTGIYPKETVQFPPFKTLRMVFTPS